MADFLCAFLKLAQVEGEYANDPLDRGGETYMGISRKHHPSWDGWAIIDEFLKNNPPSALPSAVNLMNAVRNFYAWTFWDPLSLQSVKGQRIAEELFDSAVNCGPGQAVKWLQRALNMLGASLVVDGDMGPVTLKALNDCKHQEALWKTMNGLQFMHYHQLVERDPTQKRFFRGWVKRVWE